ncbi:MAG: IS1595 family transposase, partial [Xanthobacteraceae bacterium]
MSANLQNPIFTDETKAREWLEARVWPNGPVCPHCGSTDDDVTKLDGKAHRPGLYQCAVCREQFTVTVKTVFERSKIPLSKWLAALFLLTASKKGVSAHQVHRSLGISYKSAWFMMHRLREALRTGGFSPLGSGGKVVESDETFIGRKVGVRKPKSGFGHKNVVLTLVERGGKARSFHVDSTRAADVVPVVRANVAREAKVVTDEASHYMHLGRDFARHDTVNHGLDEYARYERDKDGAEYVIHTNTVEGYYSIFKR